MILLFLCTNFVRARAACVFVFLRCTGLWPSLCVCALGYPFLKEKSMYASRTRGRRVEGFRKAQGALNSKLDVLGSLPPLTL